MFISLSFDLPLPRTRVTVRASFTSNILLDLFHRSHQDRIRREERLIRYPTSLRLSYLGSCYELKTIFSHQKKNLSGEFRSTEDAS